MHRSLRALVPALATLGLSTGLLVGMTGAVSASGLIPTTTSVSAAPTSILQGASVTLTASVNLGLLITPAGTVDFTASNGGAPVDLGSAPVSNLCSGSNCTATLTTSALPAGTDTVTASYSGDAVSSPSQGSTGVTVTPVTTVTCTSNNPCTGHATSPDQTTALTVQTNQKTGGTITIYFDNSTLACTTQGTSGDTAIFNVASNSAPSKLLEYDLYGVAATAKKSHNPTTLCYGSPHAFSGATFVNGEYEGSIGLCDADNDASLHNNDDAALSNAPCVTGFTYNSKPSPKYSAFVAAPAGDPKLSH